MDDKTLWGALCVGATLALAYYPSTAEACGGMFCDAGPTAMPVDQTGENILFAMGETTIEAHIQIQYDPESEAQQFAWVVPVTQVPSFQVGSDQLFVNVLSGTVPAYGFSTTFDSCGDDGNGGVTAGSPTTGAGGGDTTGGGDATSDGGGPEVVYQDTVGAFDIVVLQGGTSMEVMEWLAANGYQQDPAAEPILQEYLDEGYLFAAFRLANDAETAEIHPIVLVFDNDEACIPLRLTRIAAKDDMDVRSFFLADSRVVPQNYKHVLVNPLAIDWNGLGANYKELITLAVDADQANGHAFVTEYAGTSEVVDRFGIYGEAWNAAPFEGVDPTGVVELLEIQNLLSCFTTGLGESACSYNHPLIRGLLLQYLPVPAGVEEGEFYECLSCFAGLIDMTAWDGAAFAQALQERIIDPGWHAVELLDAYPMLTRMYTTISPGEMTQDPFFFQNPDLPDVDLTSQIATRRMLCNGAALWTLPDERVVYAPDPNTWPVFPDQMPWEEEVEEMATQGAPLSLVDNSALIDTLLTEHNCQYDYPTAEACGGALDGGSSDESGDGGT
ncbi:MAG: DUF2330 domain-containing protein, partial [Myxococcales bacterium]|nr:DUF2330 domain-containing protein [Myxococcales bacterium]